MVRLTEDKPYTLHARSIDRIVGTPSDYKLNLRDPLTCEDDHYIKATFVSCTMPSTFYQINSRNNKFTVRFNQRGFTGFDKYATAFTLQNVGTDTTQAGVAISSLGVQDRYAYARTVAVTISVGNYNVEELLSEITTKLNAACLAAHTGNLKFRTFLRDDTDGSVLHSEDEADSGAPAFTTDFLQVAPQFSWAYSKTLNKQRLYRTDAGGKMYLGQFDIQTSGQKLAMALGLSHNTAQEMADARVSLAERTSVEASVHFRRHLELGLALEHYDFAVPQKEAGVTNYGHSVFSKNCVNMFANDSVYVRCLSLPSNSYETLRGAQTNIMAVIPLYSGAGSDNFHSPEYPTSAVIGKMGISDIDVRLTDAMGEEMDLNGVEWEFQMTFEVFPETKDKRGLAFDMAGSHARESAPKPSWLNRNNA
jgi:hypothetical protein